MILTAVLAAADADDDIDWTVSATPRACGPTSTPPDHSSKAYLQRNTVERCINHLKQWRGLAARTDKPAIAYQAVLHLVGILVRTRH